MAGKYTLLLRDVNQELKGGFWDWTVRLLRIVATPHDA